MNSSFRPGMQVHAVPDDERAADASGKKLPWAYEYADSSLNRRLPIERGPFGKTTNRRSTSRSKTATPSTKEDLARQENLRTIDMIFAPVVEKLRENAKEQPKPAPASSMSHQRQTADSMAPAASSAAPSHPRKIQEPTEVMLYGFGSDFQYAAIDYYENASKGNIYEDYDRQPPHPRYNNTLSMRRPVISRNLPREAIGKINAYKGGDHWIKVTFDSPEAAELACHYSPHVINGYLVYCELYRGVGPNADVAIPAVAGEDPFAVDSRPQRRNTRQHAQQRGYNTMPGRAQSTPNLLGPQAREQLSPAASESTASSGTAMASGTDIVVGHSDNALQTQAQQDPHLKPLRIRGATRAVLLPASQALLPVPPWTTRVFGTWPIIGSFLGGDGADIIGGVVPRKEDKDGVLGEFDWDKASFWWRACWWIDQKLGTDLCGIRGED